MIDVNSLPESITLLQYIGKVSCCFHRLNIKDSQEKPQP